MDTGEKLQMLSDDEDDDDDDDDDDLTLLSNFLLSLKDIAIHPERIRRRSCR